MRNPVKQKITVEKKPMLYPQPSPSLPYGNQIRRHDYTRHKSTKQNMNPQNFRNSRRYNQNQKYKTDKGIYKIQFIMAKKRLHMGICEAVFKSI